jgi:predicted nucleotidyltransferase
MGTFSDRLDADRANQKRVMKSDERWRATVQLITTDKYFADTAFTVFVAGSMGRSEMGVRSDIDLFLISRRNCDEAEKVQLIASLDDLNKNLGYPPFTTRRFLKVYHLDDLIQKTGSPQDDNENCFTVRMLLLLESRVLANGDTYSVVLEKVLEQYFRDQRQTAYRPLFLLNDILRYWRTLCLNYEELRHDRARPWWKKNINLKFSRMITVFATVAALTVRNVHSMSDFSLVCALTPLRRLAIALDSLNDDSLMPEFEQFLLDYEQFLCWKDDASIIDATVQEESFKQSVRASADRVSDFLYHVLMNTQIPEIRKKFLVL